jgi:hypothetical protein
MWVFGVEGHGARGLFGQRHKDLGSTLRRDYVPKHRYAAGLSSLSPLFPSCLPRAAKSYAGDSCAVKILICKKTGVSGLGGCCRRNCASQKSLAQRG